MEKQEHGPLVLVLIRETKDSPITAEYWNDKGKAKKYAEESFNAQGYYSVEVIQAKSLVRWGPLDQGPDFCHSESCE